MSEKDIDSMTLDELKAYNEALDMKILKKNTLEKAKKLEEEEKLEKEKLKQEQLDVLKAEAKIQAEEELYKEHPEYRPHSKLNDVGEVRENTTSVMQQYYNGYYERQKNKQWKSHSNYLHTIDTNLNEHSGDNPIQIIDGGKNTEGSWNRMFSNTDSDTGCEDDVSAWSPADVYSKIVWNTFLCKADLFRIAVKGIVINPGDGLSVQIRAYSALGDPVEKASCECNTCVSISFSTYTLTLKQYSKEVIVCEKDIWDVGSILMDSYMRALSDMWAAWFDYQIYNELETATPGTTETLTTALACTPSIAGSCCSDAALVELYNAVQSAVATMREGTNPYNPDYMIISPSVAAIFKRMQTPQPVFVNDVVIGTDGRLKSIAGLEVIEYCRANSCTDLSSEVVAIIIDSRRAVGAAFGQRPTTYKFFQSNCNSTRIDSWSFFACGELDTNAIAHIVNP